MRLHKISLGLVLALQPLSACPMLAQVASIEEFVHRPHFYGVPYDEARAYPPSVAPQLLRMLDDPAEVEHLPVIVVALAMIGDESVVSPLIDFARRGSGALTPDEYRAKSIVPMVLGYVVNHTRSRVALNYLLSSLRPRVWEDRGFLWTSPFDANRDARDLQLSISALLGLALSGHPEAGDALRSLAEGLAFRGQLAASEVASLRPIAQRAVLEFDAVSRLGLSGYYARSLTKDGPRP